MKYRVRKELERKTMGTKKIGFLLAVALAVPGFLFAAPQEGGGTARAYTFRSGKEGITLNAENMAISTLLKVLSVQEHVNIIATGRLEGTVSVNLYDVTLDQVLDAVLKPNGYGYLEKDGVWMVMKAEELSAFEAPPGPMITRIFRLNYLNLQEAENFVKPLLSKEGILVAGEKPASGIPTSTTDTGGDSSASSNTLLVRDRESVIHVVEKTLRELDVRPRQVLVETTILEAILDDDSVLGVDFNALGGIDFSDLGTTSNLFSVTPGEAAGDQLEDTLIGARDTGFAENDPAGGFSFGILHDRVGLFIQALENVVDSNVIANPKVLALNRQKAEIIIGGRLGYYGDSTISNGLSQQSVEFLETGTQLRFRPFISDDGYVRLEIRPARSSGVVDPTTGLPSESTSEVTTNIMVKGGDTVVIGGLIEEKDTLVEKRVPFLGTVPVLGWLFKRKETQTRRTEIIVLITPHIIDPARPDDAGEKEIARFRERKRLFRDGFLFCSRTLYATRHRAAAEEALRKGDLEEARYHFRRAAALDPNHPDLPVLEERLAAGEAREKTPEKDLEGYLRSEIQ